VSEPKIKFGHRLEAALVATLIALLRLLPPVLASRAAGAVAGFIGPLVPPSPLAGQNLRLAMPELSAPQRQRIIKACWANLGMTAAELVHLAALKETPTGPGYSITGWDEHVAPALAAGGRAIFFTGHLANWEVLPVAAHTHGMEMAFMYRAASNPLVNGIILRLREAQCGRQVKMFAKGAAGGKAAYAHLLKGGVLGLLVDQKLDTGIAAPLFGHTAMTMDALALFALKFRCPVLPARVVREGPARLRVVCEAPLTLPATGDRAADSRTLTVEMNRILEGWIRENPGDWLWLHRRWPKAAYRVLS
jgi:KDO2-lipid IV(A) lauroyltransferase